MQVPVATHVSDGPPAPSWTQHCCDGLQTSGPHMTGGGGGGLASMITPLELLLLVPLLLVVTPLLLLVLTPLLVPLVVTPLLLLLVLTPLLVLLTPLLLLLLLVLTPLVVLTPLLTPLLLMTPLLVLVLMPLLDSPPSSVCSSVRSPSRTVRPPQAATRASAVGRKALISLIVVLSFRRPSKRKKGAPNSRRRIWRVGPEGQSRPSRRERWRLYAAFSTPRASAMTSATDIHSASMRASSNFAPESNTVWPSRLAPR